MYCTRSGLQLKQSEYLGDAGGNSAAEVPFDPFVGLQGRDCAAAAASATDAWRLPWHNISQHFKTKNIAGKTQICPSLTLSIAWQQHDFLYTNLWILCLMILHISNRHFEGMAGTLMAAP